MNTKTLKNGEENLMDSKQIVEILKACKDLNLKKLTVGNLKLEFQDSENLTIDDTLINNKGTKMVLSSDHTELPNETTITDSSDEDANESGLEELNDLELGLMMVQDPVAYEEKLKELNAS